jgi:hypothetical protein
VQESNNIEAWKNLEKQATGQENKNIVHSEALQNIVNKLPDGAMEQMKELSGKAAEGMARLSDKAKEYGGKMAEEAAGLKDNITGSRQEKKQSNQEYVNVIPKTQTKEQKKGSAAKLLFALLLLICIVGAGTIFYLSRFTLVGVWKLVDTDKASIDMSNFDLTDPEDILKKSLLTLGSGTRIVFTKEGDVFATASLGSVTTNLGKMQYTKNGNDSFTINVSIDVLLTTLTAGYSCNYEFDGPNRLIIYIDGAKLELTRDKEGDPEEYLEKVNESSFGINLNLGGSDDEKDSDGSIEIPQSSEELMDDLQDVGDKIGGFVGDFIGN